MNEEIVTIGCFEYPETILKFNKKRDKGSFFLVAFIVACLNFDKKLITNKQALSMINEAIVKDPLNIMNSDIHNKEKTPYIFQLEHILKTFLPTCKHIDDIRNKYAESLNLRNGF